MKKNVPISCLLIVYCSLSISTIFAQSGTLDPGFASGGIFMDGHTTYDDYAHAGIIQPDGKIVVAGTSGDGAYFHVTVLRLNTDGSLDNSFDGDGKLTTIIDSLGSSAYAIALQTDGKILVGGYKALPAFGSDYLLLRYNTDGSLDNTFSTDGMVTTDFAGNGEFIQSIQVQADGKIVVAGYTAMPISIDFALARFNTDGSLDVSFSGDGKVTTDFWGLNDLAFDMVIQPDGKIIAVGSTDNGMDEDFALARYNTDGSLDNSFDTDGKIMTNVVEYDDAYSIALQSDNKIVVGGDATVFGNGYDFALVRYNTNGSVDSSFDVDGKVTTHFGYGNERIAAIDIQSDGKIVAMGDAVGVADDDLGIAVYDTNGTLFTGFDTDGIILSDFGDNNNLCADGFVQPDGKIVAIGWATDGSDLDMAVSRYEGTLIGIEENTLINNVHVFPNPTANAVTISTAEELVNASLQLVNITGQVMWSHQNINGNSFTIDMTSLAGGTYFVELREGGKVGRMKVLKK